METRILAHIVSVSVLGAFAAWAALPHLASLTRPRRKRFGRHLVQIVHKQQGRSGVTLYRQRFVLQSWARVAAWTHKEALRTSLPAEREHLHVTLRKLEPDEREKFKPVWRPHHVLQSVSKEVAR